MVNAVVNAETTYLRLKVIDVKVNGLTPKQAAFVQEYLIDRNATQAAIRAGYSRKTARQIGDENLSKPDIRIAIDAGFEALAQSADLSAREVMNALARTIRFDPRKLFNPDGSMKSLDQLDDDSALCLTGIETIEISGPNGAPIVVRKIKWEAKTAARDQALRVLGMYKNDNKQKAGVLDGLPREMVKLMIEKLQALSAEGK